jgi:PEP-CTERM motif
MTATILRSARGGAFGLCLALPAQAAVLNGGFDVKDHGFIATDGQSQASLVGQSGGASWSVFRSLPDWRTASGSGIELQTAKTVGLNPHSGDFYVELDSDPRGSSNSRMEQDIVLKTGRYELSFFYSPRNPVPNDTDGIAFDIDGGVLAPAFVTSTDGVRGKWTEITRSFFVRDAGTYTLGFEANQRQDTLGGFVDSVSIAPVPLPAAGWMLLAGLGALGAASRRRKAAAA